MIEKAQNLMKKHKNTLIINQNSKIHHKKSLTGRNKSEKKRKITRT